MQRPLCNISAFQDRHIHSSSVLILYHPAVVLNSVCNNHSVSSLYDLSLSSNQLVYLMHDVFPL
jgi:hypothetical protein